jgi:hypothetical protein
MPSELPVRNLVSKPGGVSQNFLIGSKMDTMVCTQQAP